MANILGVPVVKPKVTDISALGAAYAAGLAVGVWNDIEDLRNHWQMDRIWKPEMDIETRKKLYDEWEIATRKALEGVV